MANFEKIYKRVASPVITLCVIGLLLTSTFPINDVYADVNIWTEATTIPGIEGTGIRAVSMTDSINGVAATAGIIIYTRDGGDTWTTASGGVAGLYGISMGDANNGVAVGGTGKIVYTDDGGVTWADATTIPGTITGTTTIYGVSMGDASNGVAVTNGKKIVYTDDGGVTWAPSDTTGIRTLRAVSMSDASNGVIVGDSGEILYTTNGGVLGLMREPLVAIPILL